jgi:anti-anti-sigma regulatory factor
MKEFQLTSSKDKSSGTTNVNLQGKLNVANISSIHSDLQKSIKGSKKIAVTLENVDDADVSTIQLLKAFQSTCTTNKVEVNFSLNLSEDIEVLFKKSGFLNLFK